MLRSRALDVLTGIAGLALSAAALLLQGVSRVAMEYGLIVLPVVVFPLLTWLRVRAGSPPWFAFAAVNVWLVIAEAALAKLALASIVTLVIPLIIGLGASAVVALLRSATSVAAVAVAAIAGIMVTPSVWNGMLTKVTHTAAPDISLTLLDGRQVRLAELHGKVVVLNFWGVWCAPCVEELPELADFARSRSADVIAVNSAIGKETPEQIARFLRAHNLALTVAFDPARTAYRAFGVNALPTTVVIDPQGIVRQRRVGFAATARFGAWLAGEVRHLRSSDA